MVLEVAHDFTGTLKPAYDKASYHHQTSPVHPLHVKLFKRSEMKKMFFAAQIDTPSLRSELLPLPKSLPKSQADAVGKKDWLLHLHIRPPKPDSSEKPSEK